MGEVVSGMVRDMNGAVAGVHSRPTGERNIDVQVRPGCVLHGNMVGMVANAPAGRHGGRRGLLVVLSVVVAGTVTGWLLLPDDAEREIVPRTPGDLTSAQEDYDGGRVRTVGVVRRFGPEDEATRVHYVVEDVDQNRIGLIGGDPDRYVGRTVAVVGTFRFDPDVGRWIEVERIEDG